MVQRFPKIPKTRVRADLHMTDGSVMPGDVFIPVNTRVQDLLNAAEHFFPFIAQNGDLVLINKASVRLVRPYD